MMSGGILKKFKWYYNKYWTAKNSNIETFVSFTNRYKHEYKNIAHKLFMRTGGDWKVNDRARIKWT